MLQRHGLSNELERCRFFVRVHGRVDVRSQRLTPVRHGEIRIQPRGFPEGTARLCVIERIGEAQPLIHECLRVRVPGAHSKRVAAQVLGARRQGPVGDGSLASGVSA